MALIYADNNRRDLGYLKDINFDCDIGNSDDFALEQSADDYSLINSGYFIYDDERPEFGGRIEAITSKSADYKIVWGGKSFRGLLKNKRIDTGTETSLTLTGTPQEIITELITLCGFNGLYFCSGGSLTSVAHTFERFTDLHTAISELSQNNGLRFSCLYNISAKKIEIVVSTPSIYHKFDNDKYGLEVFKQLISVNHLIVIGDGITKHLYLQSDGSISEIPTYTDENEVTDILEVNSSDASELISEGTARFTELIAGESSAAVNTADVDFKIGDQICVIDNITRLQVCKSIKSKVYTYTDKDNYKISYKTE